jgi:aminoglycoside phosphotransferase (APT) family kinase protein
VGSNPITSTVCSNRRIVAGQTHERRDHGRVLGDDLLAELRGRLPGEGLAYVEPPVRLGGGFFTENHAFRLANMSPPWDKRLVLRLFPASVAPGLAGIEAATQTMLAGHGFPAPAVVLFDAEARLDGRRFFVMEMLEGHPLMSDIKVRDLVSTGWTLLRRLAPITASVHVMLHRIDPAPLLAELSEAVVGVPRWFAQLDEQVQAGATGLETARRWLIDNVPPTPRRLAVCHGDSWGGNILVHGHQVTGVVDWTVVTVADPHLDLGFTSMALSLAPIAAPRPIQRIAARIGGGIAARYLRTYIETAPLNGFELSTLRYYEALRTAVELSVVAAYRLAEASGQPHDIPPPTWLSIVPDMVEFFRARTGVAIDMPGLP